jgi:hypothetical protein
VEEKYGPYAAFCFDSAVATFGVALDAELDSIEGKTSKETNQKRDRTMRKWLGLPIRYRNPGGPTATRQQAKPTEVQRFALKQSDGRE